MWVTVARDVLNESILGREELMEFYYLDGVVRIENILVSVSICIIRNRNGKSSKHEEPNYVLNIVLNVAPTFPKP